MRKCVIVESKPPFFNYIIKCIKLHEYTWQDNFRLFLLAYPVHKSSKVKLLVENQPQLQVYLLSSISLVSTQIIISNIKSFDFRQRIVTSRPQIILGLNEVMKGTIKEIDLMRNKRLLTF